MQQSVAYIFTHCTQLSGLSFQGDFPLLPHIQRSSDLEAGPPCLPEVTALRLYDEWYVTLRSGSILRNIQALLRPALSTQLSALTRLVSLSINAICMESGAEVNLPRLETLNVLLADAPGYGVLLPYSWTLHSLKNLRFQRGYSTNLRLDLSASFLDSIVQFCQRHGANLRVLDFGNMVDRTREWWPTFPVRQALAAKHCPQLQHLVFRIGDEDDMNDLRRSSMFSHPVDLVHIVYDPDMARESFPSCNYHRGSAWKTVRYIDQRILLLAVDFIYVIPTLEAFSHVPQVHRYYGMDIVETAHGFLLDKEPRSESRVDGDDNDPSSESIYGSPSNIDGDSPPESEVSGSDAESLDYDGSEPENEADIAQFTEDDVLSMYSRSLELDALGDDDA